MQVTVYLDLIFLINFCVAFYVLVITGWLLKAEINYRRIGFGALFEALVLLPLIMYPQLLIGIPGIILSVAISMGTIKIALGKSGGFIKKWFLSTTVMTAFGGVFQLLKNIMFPLHINMYKWMIIFMISGILIIIIAGYYINLRQRYSNIYRICIICGQRKAECNVFLDTGNHLKDYLFGKPVLILSEEIVENVLSDKEIDFIKEYKKKGYIDYQNPIVLNSQKNICFHEIAYKSVGRSSGKLLCFLLESVEISGREKVLKKQPVAIVDNRLFKNREYKGLLFPDEI